MLIFQGKHVDFFVGSYIDYMGEKFMKKHIQYIRIIGYHFLIYMSRVS